MEKLDISHKSGNFSRQTFSRLTIPELKNIAPKKFKLAGF
jgi:hypothetical protein